MKMRKFLLIGSLLTFILCGCASTDEAAAEKRRILEKEKQIGESMIDAFRKRDMDGFLRHTPSAGRRQYGKKEFEREQQEVASRLGEIVSYRFLTTLEMEPAHQLVWAVRFRSRKLNGEPAYREALFVVVIGEVDGQRKVFLFGFK